VYSQNVRCAVKRKEPIRLLLVDDETEFLEAITPALVRRGFALTLTEDGQAALRLLARQSFDVVVLDVKMPGIDGIEVLHRIRGLLPRQAVVLLTGHPSVGDALETSRNGVFEYLTKPCDIELLASVARAAATQPGAGAHLPGDTAG
jgi:DNA-binding NtrC family response regulator